jgi:hypothetical protein
MAKSARAWERRQSAASAGVRSGGRAGSEVVRRRRGRRGREVEESDVVRRARAASSVMTLAGWFLWRVGWVRLVVLEVVRWIGELGGWRFGGFVGWLVWVNVGNGRRSDWWCCCRVWLRRGGAGRRPWRLCWRGSRVCRFAGSSVICGEKGILDDGFYVVVGRWKWCEEVSAIGRTAEQGWSSRGGCGYEEGRRRWW